MHPAKLARISVLALVLFLSALPTFAAPPCNCNFCQRFPERTCNFDGTATTCLDFLIVALCQPLPPANSADTRSSDNRISEESFFAAISGRTTQEPAGCLNPTS